MMCIFIQWNTTICIKKDEMLFISNRDVGPRHYHTRSEVSQTKTSIISYYLHVEYKNELIYKTEKEKHT